MSKILILKTALIWFLIAGLAVVNGVLRESVIAPFLGSKIALPLSGITLSIIVFMVIYLSFNFFGRQGNMVYIFMGIQLVFMTLAFEFLFGHYVAGKSWMELLQVFNVLEGDLFLLVLIVCLLSPFGVAGMKRVS